MRWSSLISCFAKHLTAVLAAVSLAVGVAHADQLTVTLLGTGSPVPSPIRFSQSTLVEAGKEKLLFDFGRGVTIRLFQLHIPFREITAHFLSHMHSDHLVGLPDLWLTGWLPPSFGSRKSPMVIYGPKGTVSLTENLTKAFAEDIRIRKLDELLTAQGIAFMAHDIEAGTVYEKNGVTVKAFNVNHGEFIEPAFGYVVEFDGKRVVITGDTKYDERIAAASKDADLLIHEVAAFDQEMVKANPQLQRILDHHTSPEEAGRIFSLAKPRLAAYTHIITLKPGGFDLPTGEIVNRTRTTYSGPLVVGEDLMRFVVGETIKAFGAKGELVLEVGARPRR